MKPFAIIQAPPPVTVAEIVASDYRKAAVFNQFGIDFCCGGKKPLDQVCREKNVDFQAVQAALFQVDVKPGNGIHWDFQSWNPAFLIDFIVNAHHAYVREQLPRLLAYGEKVARVHGGNHAETIAIFERLQALAAELQAHMLKEENILFPYIKYLVQAGEANATPAPPPFGAVQNPIRVMEHEHENAGALMAEIRSLSDDFTPPADACNTYRVYYASLRDFEEDLHLHVHLENNILFPKAVQLEGN